MKEMMNSCYESCFSTRLSFVEMLCRLSCVRSERAAVGANEMHRAVFVR